MHTLPISLHLRARTVLVVGGAAAVASHPRVLFATGARVRVVAERLDDDLEDALLSGCGAWERRGFAPRDLHDAVLVLAATGNAEGDGAVIRAARVARVPVAVAGRPDLSDFDLPEALPAYRFAGDSALGTDLPPRHNQPP
jgi:siroheme synthase-like protein